VIRELVPEDREAIEEALTECGAFSEEEIRVALELFEAGAPGGIRSLAPRSRAAS
jgi:hypothetical protein